MLHAYYESCRKITVKTIRCIQNKKKGETASSAKIALQELADGLDLEEVETHLRETKENGPGEKDNESGLIDELAAMTVSEREEWEEQVLPTKSVLAKV